MRYFISLAFSYSLGSEYPLNLQVLYLITNNPAVLTMPALTIAKKALLVGVQYKPGADHDLAELVSTHKDVARFTKLLIGMSAPMSLACEGTNDEDRSIRL